MFSQDINLIQMISNSGLMVNLVLVLLLSFSVVCWAIILIKFRYIRRAFKESTWFTDYFWKSRDLSDAFIKAKQIHYSPIAQVFRIGYIELKKVSQTVLPSKSQGNSQESLPMGAHFTGIDNVSRALRRASDAEISRITQMVPFLATTGNTAPFIGLFGTVWGITVSYTHLTLPTIYSV